MLQKDKLLVQEPRHTDSCLGVTKSLAFFKVVWKFPRIQGGWLGQDRTLPARKQGWAGSEYRDP